MFVNEGCSFESDSIFNRSQCRDFSTGIMWVHLREPVATHAAAFCRHCRLLGLILFIDKPLYKELQLSCLLLTSAFSTEIATVFGRYCLILCRSWEPPKYDLLTASTCLIKEGEFTIKYHTQVRHRFNRLKTCSGYLRWEKKR